MRTATSCSTSPRSASIPGCWRRGGGRLGPPASVSGARRQRGSHGVQNVLKPSCSSATLENPRAKAAA